MKNKQSQESHHNINLNTRKQKKCCIKKKLECWEVYSTISKASRMEKNQSRDKKKILKQITTDNLTEQVNLFRKKGSQ